MALRHGDRVRIRKERSEYTGCRGMIVQEPRQGRGDLSALGYFVAVDGENGKTRPFLVTDLEVLQAASVRRPQGSVSAKPLAREK
jgi:hypothetical protein